MEEKAKDDLIPCQCLARNDKGQRKLDRVVKGQGVDGCKYNRQRSRCGTKGDRPYSVFSLSGRFPPSSSRSSIAKSSSPSSVNPPVRLTILYSQSYKP